MSSINFRMEIIHNLIQHEVAWKELPAPLFECGCLQQVPKDMGDLRFLIKGREGQAFYPSTFACSRFSSKIQFLYCLLNSVAPWGGPMVDTKGKTFQI